jgi:hypothetical protein
MTLLRDQREREREKQNQREQKECESAQHDWQTHTYCRNCGEYFDVWFREQPKRTAFEILIEDLPSVLDGMLDEKLIKKGDAREINRRMRRKAVDRGFFKHV